MTKKQSDSRISCPDCGEPKTLELLSDEADKLNSELSKRRAARYSREYQQSKASNNLGSISIGSHLAGGNGGYAGGITTGVGGTQGGTQGGNTIIGGYGGSSGSGGFISIDSSYNEHPRRSGGIETCVGCGRTYNPSVKKLERDLLEEIEDLKGKLYSPLERLAQASD